MAWPTCAQKCVRLGNSGAAPHCLAYWLFRILIATRGELKSIPYIGAVRDHELFRTVEIVEMLSNVRTNGMYHHTRLKRAAEAGQNADNKKKFNITEHAHGN